MSFLELQHPSSEDGMQLSFTPEEGYYGVEVLGYTQESVLQSVWGEENGVLKASWDRSVYGVLLKESSNLFIKEYCSKGDENHAALQ
ncbi:hypothetical protein AVEN_220430-1 [Araneus ventricosus]|uniref:Uncharacterized protein n=1 Tax=Araneus ventricosus TaxID=182803 RepID=A0A4Y2IQC5_ARAVE|nr:hypothetical protein AVEN_220430-1 [Araneus ventricosus]